jgi:hypothetical protein
VLSDRPRLESGLVAVQTRNPLVTRLLEAILAEWQLSAHESAEARVTLVERGLPAPAGQEVIWLTPMPLGEQLHLELPLCLTELYHCLEQFFFPLPRRHIRLTTLVPVDLNVRSVWLVGRLLSLSDHGARIACPATLPKGEPVLLDFKLDNFPLRVQTEVLYEIPAGDTEGYKEPQAGLLFKPLNPDLRQALRHYIENSCLQRACALTGTSPHDPALSWFKVVSPWAPLPGPPSLPIASD